MKILILIINILVSFNIVFAVDSSLPLANSDFETVSREGFASQWTIGMPKPVHGNEVMLDSNNSYSGKRSLSITHKNWGRSVVVSQPLALKVGELYRLSGWIKTSSAVTWPTDRYPTSVAACLTMESFPFTNHSPSVGATSGWKKIEILFLASHSQDRIRLHLGFNGNAMGKAWFDHISLEKVEDISGYIPMETVKWCGPGFRYDDKGWIFVHVEGKPYQRGYQYGYLLADEMVAYMRKVSVDDDESDPVSAWSRLRRITHAFMINKYDEEYLLEMKGIADGAARWGVEINGKTVDFLDVVTINSYIDIDSAWGALRNTPHPLSGRNFLDAEDEMNIPLKQHKCSGLLANGPATPDGDVVFGQIFMWSGYTGVHWNVICDVVPENGHRLVYETFPGGIHSGADFYLNDAGIVIGETTVRQSPFNMEGTPQSNRIRKAAQYADNIDDVVRILSLKNNGMYTNDWLIADTRANEIAIFLLGTKKSKLWRSSKGEFPGETQGFYWSNNNNKDMEVRKEYIANADNAPYDLVFKPWNRDVAFNRFFQKHKGNIDTASVVNLWASTPINMSHACDGKITGTEMAGHMVFLAHFGKVTLREKFPAKDFRILRDKEGATPHLSLGYSVVSPVFIAEKLKDLKRKFVTTRKDEEKSLSPSIREPDFEKIKDFYSFNPRKLWFNTVFPSSNRENWFVSSTAAYWSFLKNLPNNREDKKGKTIFDAFSYLSKKMAGLDVRLMYTMSREGAVSPLDAKLVYDEYKHYQIPLIRGTFLLHQLRLYLGNDTFSRVMNAVHKQFKEKPVTTRQLITLMEKTAGIPLNAFIMQWIHRKDFPQITIESHTILENEKWKLQLDLTQDGFPFHFITTVAIETEKGKKWDLLEMKGKKQSFVFSVKEKPVSVEFNAGNDIPIPRKNFYTFSNYYDDYHHTIFVYGTARQIEGNHTLTLRYRDLLANRFTEILPKVKKDSEVNREELAGNDLFILGSAIDNALLKQVAADVGLVLGKNYFQWQGKTYGDADDGLYVAYPNPYNPRKVVYLVIANSALQLHQMTKKYNKLPSWALFKGDKIVDEGYHPVKKFKIIIPLP